ncbi:MAG: hypothetical protein ACKVX9_01525 [Blastocatellia bacterium]
MNFFKIIAFILGLVVAVLIAMSVLGMAFALFKLAFVLAVIVLIVGGLWKLFGGGKGSGALDESPPGRLENVEMTIDEYKRKLEAEINQRD